TRCLSDWSSDVCSSDLGKLLDLGDDLLPRHGLAAVEGVLGVAVLAAQVAAGEADEDAGLPGQRRLALDAEEDLRHAHAPGSTREIGRASCRETVWVRRL